MFAGLRPVTVALAAFSVGLTLLWMTTDDKYSTEVLNQLGVFSLDQVWDGAWWAYFTCLFKHGNFIHLAFNLYWLWMFGSVLEDRLGSPRFLGLVVLTAFVSSGLEMAAGNTGVGLSGVGYGLFGYMWLRSRFDPEYSLRRDIVQLFVVWFFICIFLTEVDILPIANFAHGGGFLAGATVAMAERGSDWRWRVGGALGLLVVLAISATPLIAMPWNLAWLRHRGDESHEAGQNERALEFYNRVLARDPGDARITWNRGVAHQDLGQMAEAARDWERAAELDPKFRLRRGD